MQGMKNKTAIILPAYNEESRIGSVVEEVKKYVDEVVVVDDGSADGTSEIARHHGAVVIRHRINIGKGAALKTGVEGAIARGADIIVLMDADGQHPPNKIPFLINDIATDNYDVVFTYRPLDKSMPLYRRLGNMALNSLARKLFHVCLNDIWCGFRAFKAEVYGKIKWIQSSYSADVEMALRTAKNNLKYREISIPTIYHDAYKGVSIIDGIKLLFTIIMWRITL